VKKDKINITRFGQDQLRKRKKKWIKPVIIGIVLTAIFAFLALKSEDIIHTNIVKLSVDNDANATWIGSLASYWGGILGGIFSGTIAIFGVFYTIQFTREADRNKERQSIQPFLNVKIVAPPSGGTVKQFKIADEPKFIDGKAEQLFYPIYLSITNIGNGFANTMTFGTGENLTGLSYKEVFTINETKVVKLDVQTYKMSKGVSFFIWFADSMTNEYIQYYELNRDSSGTGYELDIGYPNLIE
jgi:hypothetical protein